MAFERAIKVISSTFGTTVEVLENLCYGIAWSAITPAIVMATYQQNNEKFTLSGILPTFLLLNIIFSIGQFTMITKKYKNAKTCTKAFWILIGGIGFYSTLYYFESGQKIVPTEDNINYIIVAVMNIVWILQSVEINIIRRAVKGSNGRKR